MAENELITILATVQAELKNPPLDAKNPHFGSSYTKLPTILDMVRGALAKHGAFLTQRSEFEFVADAQGNQKPVRYLVTEVYKGGEKMELNRCMVPYTGNVQKDWGAVTYAKRYSLCEVFAIAGEEDDDGEGAASDASTTCPKCGKVWQVKHDGRAYQCSCGAKLT